MDEAHAGVRNRRIIMVPDRLPVTLEVDANDEWQTEPVSGGLVTALDPIMRDRGGVWIGWPGVASNDDTELRNAIDRQYNANADYRLAPVALCEEEVQGFYKGFANEIIWPLFHNQFTACNFDPDFWRVYQDVNRKFGYCVAAQTEADDFIWVHDYQLMTLGQHLRASNIHNRCGFFLHIPFPTRDIFSNLPWCDELLQALLAYDFIGFQTVADQNNFLDCVAFFCDNTRIKANNDRGTIEVVDSKGEQQNRQLDVGALPTSIDYEGVSQMAQGERATAYFQNYRKRWGAATFALGVDRLDSSKGLPQKLKAFRQALIRYPELRGRLSLDQYVVPARERPPKYAEQKVELERLVGNINGELTQPGWMPIHYFFCSLKREELMAYYRAAAIALITPLKDGMNLVAKEYCAAQLDETGVLILSKFAGAQAELGDYALLVNPHDLEGTADRIYQAYCLATDERRRRMRALRAIVKQADASTWVCRFLQAAGADRDL